LTRFLVFDNIKMAGEMAFATCRASPTCQVVAGVGTEYHKIEGSEVEITASVPCVRCWRIRLKMPGKVRVHG